MRVASRTGFPRRESSHRIVTASQADPNPGLWPAESVFICVHLWFSSACMRLGEESRFQRRSCSRASSPEADIRRGWAARCHAQSLTLRSQSHAQGQVTRVASNAVERHRVVHSHIPGHVLTRRKHGPHYGPDKQFVVAAPPLGSTALDPHRQGSLLKAGTMRQGHGRLKHLFDRHRRPSLVEVPRTKPFNDGFRERHRQQLSGQPERQAEQSARHATRPRGPAPPARRGFRGSGE